LASNTMFKLLSFLHLLTLALASNTAYSATAHTREKYSQQF